MSLAREALILIALAVLGAAGTQLFHPRAPQWHEVQEPPRDDEVTMEMIAQRWKSGVLWIDARPREQFKKSHIPGALNINEQELESQLIENILVLQDNKKPVVVYCDSGACQASRKIRDYLTQRLPIEEFYVLRGGWSAWEKTHAAR